MEEININEGLTPEEVEKRERLFENAKIAINARMPSIINLILLAMKPIKMENVNDIISRCDIEPTICRYYIGKIAYEKKWIKGTTHDHYQLTMEGYTRRQALIEEAKKEK